MQCQVSSETGTRANDGGDLLTRNKACQLGDDDYCDDCDDNDDYGASSGQLHTCFASCSVVNGESGCW